MHALRGCARLYCNYSVKVHLKQIAARCDQPESRTTRVAVRPSSSSSCDRVGDVSSPNKNYLRPINIVYITTRLGLACRGRGVMRKNRLSDAAAAASVGNGFAGGRACGK